MKGFVPSSNSGKDSVIIYNRMNDSATPSDSGEGFIESSNSDKKIDKQSNLLKLSTKSSNIFKKSVKSSNSCKGSFKSPNCSKRPLKSSKNLHFPENHLENGVWGTEPLQ